MYMQVRNENSSRFGKFIQILFAGDHTICGGYIYIYILCLPTYKHIYTQTHTYMAGQVFLKVTIYIEFCSNWDDYVHIYMVGKFFKSLSPYRVCSKRPTIICV
jgi:hypothetical protein